MPSNIEIKAHARNFEEIRERAEVLSERPAEVILQEDVFFRVEQGRLKLRYLAPDRGQLIYYSRPDLEGPKRSEYHIYETSDPGSLRQLLELAYGMRGSIRKTRHLFLVGQTRIHLDEVEDLGKFVELEVVMAPGQTDAEGQAIAEDLINKLGVERGDLLEGAYIDLLEKR